MPLAAATPAWSAAITVANDTYVQCRSGEIYVCYGATALAAPGDLTAGIEMLAGDLLPLKGGQDFRVVQKGGSAATFFYLQQGV